MNFRSNNVRVIGAMVALLIIGGACAAFYHVEKKNKAENEKLLNEIVELKKVIPSVSPRVEPAKISESALSVVSTPASSPILRVKVPVVAVKPAVPLDVKATFVKECENQFQDIYSKAMTPPLALIEAKKQIAMEECPKGSTFNRMESLWYCDNKIAYVQTLDDFTAYCVDWKINQLNR